MNTQIGLLVTVKNTTAAALAGIPAASSKVVFWSPSWTLGRLSVITAALVSGALEAYDLGGSKIGPQVAMGRLIALDTAAAQLAADLAVSPSALTKATHQTAWNLHAAPSVVAAVRADMVVAGLSTCGVTAAGVLAKLQGVVTLVGLGMFAEAAATLSGVTPDGYLTTQRLALYQAMLNAADALALP